MTINEPAAILFLRLGSRSRRVVMSKGHAQTAPQSEPRTLILASTIAGTYYRSEARQDTSIADSTLSSRPVARTGRAEQGVNRTEQPTSDSPIDGSGKLH